MNDEILDLLKPGTKVTVTAWPNGKAIIELEDGTFQLPVMLAITAKAGERLPEVIEGTYDATHEFPR